VPVRVLVVEDEKEPAEDIVGALRAAPEHYETLQATSGRKALQILRAFADTKDPVDCVILDLKLSDSRPGDLTVLRRMRSAHPRTPVIVVTGYGSEELVVDAMKSGAADYLAKHRMWVDALPFKVRDAVRRAGMQRANEELRASVAGSQARIARLERELRKRYRSDGIVGECAAIEQALLLTESAAHLTVPVLLVGGPGTGKTLFARTIHAHSERAGEPFELVRCTTMGGAALERVLFGERGLVSRAAGGTLFLADVDEMEPRLQARLLHLVEGAAANGDPLAGGRARTARVIAGVRSNPESSIAEGRLRDGLAKALSAITIELPILRDRGDDVRVLAEHFLRAAIREVRKPIRGFKLQVMHLLERYDWPDNVRELETEVRRAVALTPAGEFVTTDRLSTRVRQAVHAPRDERPLKDTLRDVEAAVIRSRLETFAFNRTRTALSLGVSREWLWAKIKNLRIPTRRPPAAGRKERP
jgi:DNA-binding NtrC family response regulator